MIRIFSYLFVITTVVVTLFACSTEKNTFINRTYHNTTSKYNGYFNATELVRIGLDSYRKSTKEDYYSILPIDQLPNKEEAVALFPAMDTAIAKCSKVISKHSMPTMEKISKKKDEYCKWIDENWMLIGKAEFYKTEYIKAYDNFEFVKKFYRNNSSTYSALLWMAKCEIEMGDLTKAGLKLKKLDKIKQEVIESQAESKKKKSKKSKKKDEPMAKLPKGFDLELEKTKARFALEKENTKSAIEHLTNAVGFSKNAEERARLNFIIAQLLQEQNSTEAREFYTASIKRNANYEMAFHARINRALAGGEGDEKIIKELKKMLRDEKNTEFKDQIYYALADIELDKGNKEGGMSYLTQSVFYSLNNNRQKGVSYERLGSISFDDKDYVSAQKYFDSSATVLPDTYANKDAIQNKADKLFDLVAAIEVVQFEDSVQRIAALSEKDREKFVGKVLKQIKAEEQRKKEEDAIRLEELRQLQAEYSAQNNGQGGKWYFNNSKAMAEGVNEYKRIWGARENEDDWRRSNKTPSFNLSFNDSTATDSIPDKEDGELTEEDMLANLPVSDSALAQSNLRLMEALYTSAMLYKNQLNEITLSQNQFNKVLDKNIEDRHNILSAYELFQMYDGKDQSKAEYYKNYIFNNYPNSDYANFLRDPEFFRKKKELEALELADYLKSVQRYEQGLFYPVITKAEKVITAEPDNKYRAKYLLLKAMAMGKINPDKETLLPTLEQLISEYNGTEEAVRGKELIDLIKNGVPESIPVDFTQAESLYEYKSRADMYILIYLDKNEDSRAARTKVSNFNREFFSRAKLKTTSQIINAKTTMVLVKDFDSESKASDYIRAFQRTRKHLGEMKENKIIYITPDNFKTFVKTQKIKEYEKFFEDNY